VEEAGDDAEHAEKEVDQGGGAAETYAMLVRWAHNELIECCLPHFTHTGSGGKRRARKARKMSLPVAMFTELC